MVAAAGGAESKEGGVVARAGIAADQHPGCADDIAGDQAVIAARAGRLAVGEAEGEPVVVARETGERGVKGVDETVDGSEGERGAAGALVGRAIPVETDRGDPVRPAGGDVRGAAIEIGAVSVEVVGEQDAGLQGGQAHHENGGADGEAWHGRGSSGRGRRRHEESTPDSIECEFRASPDRGIFCSDLVAHGVVSVTSTSSI
jgi:hypothetical protein